uniref:Interleukin-12 subunit beta-like n=1 Tax=Paramormyrops kingsleyae TaxID=1676925 RepID=A0A3B3Q4D7_9TELE|nr:interleukin-12 subunit beta-like [Paramormyrops kingsleyae]XP_023658629.1 interleukin-12 subunit beta-like [Paramormyrops kingsleyae]XP_023658630.1 interleukin-12 subunit beta-like [Paramormyrops kingsleyae]XP_023658631.1 interleukin-12 subunit beta-like [Paramormyrops kingsleyae]XP_023658632.1 interleukin-12 subunit beta-like [Paramormyrops kingsleyae]
MPAGSWYFLLLSLPSVWGLSSFPRHMEVSKVENSVTITCSTDLAGEVTWKHSRDGEEIRIIKGKSLELLNLEEPDAGEYSCWDGERKLNSTYLLLEEEEVDTKEALVCSAQTYSCFFTCSWSLNGYTAARLRYQRDGQDPSPWVYSEAHGEQEASVFTLQLTSSPFTEEDTPMILTGEAVSSTHYMKRTLQFFFRDIVKPDPPQLGLCKKQGNLLSVTVQPAASWAKPLSYFQLDHQIEFIYQNDGTTGLSNSTTVPGDISNIRARSREPFVPSPWSQWSPWKNMRMKRKMSDRKKEMKRLVRTSEKNNILYCRKEKKKGKAE